MILFAPEYYTRFKCIADKCSHSCCVGWEIDIDELSLKKYSELSEGYGAAIAASIEDGDPPHFRLGERDRCPHLDECGLCRIITECGEEYLSDICREHPRFSIDTARHRFVGVGMACEEAAGIILSSDGYSDFVALSECDGEEKTDKFDTHPHVMHAYRILSDKSLPYRQRLFALADAFCLNVFDIHDGEYLSLIRELEYLNEDSRDRFSVYDADSAVTKDLEAPLSRALAYFIFRHAMGARNLEEFRIGLSLAIFLERLLSSVAVSEGITDLTSLTELCRTLSEEIEYSEDNTEQIKFTFI